MSSFRAGMFNLRPTATYGQAAGPEDAALLSSARLVVVGEIHSMPPCIELQHRTATAMHSSLDDGGTLHIVLEHFNFEMQPLLDAYSAGTSSFGDVIEGSSAEGHDVAPYEPLLELGRGSAVRLHAGFIPRSFARIVMRESLDAAISAARAAGYLPEGETCEATDAHYSYFESLLTGRDVHDASRPPTDQYRKMFPAQVIKDAAMAHKVNSLIAAAGAAADKFLVCCGVGHSGYSHGVPERILAAHPSLASSIYRVWSMPVHPSVDLNSPADMAEVFSCAFGPPGTSDPAELALVFTEEEEAGVAEGAAAAASAGAGGECPSNEAAKAATEEAYNSVGETAALPGNAAKARAIMRRLGYTDDHLLAAGDDVSNYQGVACPHLLAALQPGETVLDVGSGLGVDSFIAASLVGAAGRVTGVDLSRTCVRHAAARARERSEQGLLPAPSFEVGDLERLPLSAETVDVVISNGALCLAPDKGAAFAEMLRVLRPGGRIAVCTSTMRRPLETTVDWPLYMQMFVSLEALQPLVEAAGFIDVRVDLSDTAMAFELPEEVELEDTSEAGGARQRNAVHGGSAAFEHLKEVDVNELCARVTVTGRRPL